MIRTLVAGTTLLLATSTAAPAQEGAGERQSLLEARRGFQTKLVRTQRDAEELTPPPAELFSLIRYRSPAGDLAAYVSRPPGPGKHPAIVWITGGFPPGGIGESAWEPSDPENDQSAKAYREAGLIMMYPTLRGSFGNPGRQETFFGEVDDVIAAGRHLATVEGVDPERIYLGGHSTGGTLALLVAAAPQRFRAVFAFGPVADPVGYGAEALTYDPEDAREAGLRAPIRHLAAIRTPTYVIEGTVDANLDSLRALEGANQGTALRFFAVEGAGHFDVLAPVNRLIARRLAQLDAATPLPLSAADVQAAFDDQRRAQREASDLEVLARARAGGASLETAQRARYYLLCRERAPLVAASKAAGRLGFQLTGIEEHQDRSGGTYFVLTAGRTLVLGDLKAVFAASRALAEVAAGQPGVAYSGWSAE